MEIIELRSSFSLGFECLDKKVRLIVFENGIEKACRKEKVSVLQKFLKVSMGSIFKGRIQLEKHKNEIVILLKKEKIGNVYYKEFERCLLHCDINNVISL